jgi:hypothetical protein
LIELTWDRIAVTGPQTKVTTESLVFSISAGRPFPEEALEALREHGVVVLRGVFSPDDVDFLVKGAKLLLEKPSISGSFGYYRKDHQKRFVDPFLIGEAAVDICLDERVADFVEAYMESECVLSEAFIKEDTPTSYVYFNPHSDYAPGNSRRSDSDKVMTEEDLKHPVAVGGILYFAECKEGAFCFSLGTHRLGSFRGQEIERYTPIERAEILSTWTRLVGNKGDLVLFDDRGFHGPDQPSRFPRLVMLLDWMRNESWGGPTQVAPHLIQSTDIGRLSPRQLRLLGAGATSLGPRDSYHIHQFGRKKSSKMAFRLARLIIDHTYTANHWKRSIRKWLQIQKPRSN